MTKGDEAIHQGAGGGATCGERVFVLLNRPGSGAAGGPGRPACSLPQVTPHKAAFCRTALLTAVLFHSI